MNSSYHCQRSTDSLVAAQKSTTPDQIFLASRILFLCTVSSASGAFIQSLVENKHGSSGTAVDIIGAKLDILTNSILSGTRMGREAMTDTLKLTFNLLVHYPKVWRLTFENMDLTNIGQMVDGEVQELNLKGKAKDTGDENDTKVMGDYWSPKLSPYVPPRRHQTNF
jgi:hypothetical protein